ncbi:MAG: hypothetical protein OXG79_00515 [Chloroflexi bacterium]|nr:hypothetical protein [Chloroflexota bacterium]
MTMIPSDHERLIDALCKLDPKPPLEAGASAKKGYSELMSAALAQVIAESLRNRGLGEARPYPGNRGTSGSERRMAGGIGDKKVDVTWATEESGLLIAFSVKCINFADRRSRNYQKNFTNRRGDMLFEAVTLHRRFPYATLVGIFVFDNGAQFDGTERRASTIENAHRGLRLFTGRDDPAGRDEQYEKFYLGLVSASAERSEMSFARAGEPESELALDEVITEALGTVAERNGDAYDYDGHGLSLRRSR